MISKIKLHVLKINNRWSFSSLMENCNNILLSVTTDLMVWMCAVEHSASTYVENKMLNAM